MDRLIQILSELIISELTLEFTNQGHNLTTKFIKSLEVRVTSRLRSTVLQFWGESYGNIVNRGVKASRIPYTPGRGRGGKSKYIEALIRYVRKRMRLSRKRSERVAFAIASKHKKEGMPTRASFRFSSTGKRTGFVDQMLEKNEAIIENLINEFVEDTFNTIIDNFAKAA